MRGHRRQREEVVDLLVGWWLDSRRTGERSAPLGHLVRNVSHVPSLPCGAVTLTEDELIDKGMATAVYAAVSPDRMAVISPYGQRTFRELNERANQLVRALRRLGAPHG